jgi:hypothetical protein
MVVGGVVGRGDRAFDNGVTNSVVSGSGDGDLADSKEESKRMEGFGRISFGGSRFGDDSDGDGELGRRLGCGVGRKKNRAFENRRKDGERLSSLGSRNEEYGRKISRVLAE